MKQDVHGLLKSVLWKLEQVQGNSAHIIESILRQIQTVLRTIPNLVLLLSADEKAECSFIVLDILRIFRTSSVFLDDSFLLIVLIYCRLGGSFDDLMACEGEEEEGCKWLRMAKCRAR